MDLGENADGMIVISQYAGFCHMIAFFVNIYCIGAFGTILDKTKGLKFMTFRLHHIRVIDVDDGIFDLTP